MKELTNKFRLISDYNLSGVYFIEYESLNVIKIGSATNIKRRFHALNSSFPLRLRILIVFELIEGINLEGFLNNKFKKYRIGGEFFYLNQEIKDFIKQHKPDINWEIKESPEKTLYLEMNIILSIK